MEKELEGILKDYMTARQIELAIPRVLRLFNVSGRSEQLSCETCIFNTHSWSDDYPCATCCNFDKHKAT